MSRGLIRVCTCCTFPIKLTIPEATWKRVYIGAVNAFVKKCPWCNNSVQGSEHRKLLFFKRVMQSYCTKLDNREKPVFRNSLPSDLWRDRNTCLHSSCIDLDGNHILLALVDLWVCHNGDVGMCRRSGFSATLVHYSPSFLYSIEMLRCSSTLEREQCCVLQQARLRLSVVISVIPNRAVTKHRSIGDSTNYRPHPVQDSTC